jgi:HSP90 family molecular chaperone
MLQTVKLRELVSRYSEFINFPIYMLGTKTIQVPDDEADAAAADGDDKKKEEEAAADDDASGGCRWG